jgi:polyhydroxybutyrate depolymerase
VTRVLIGVVLAASLLTACSDRHTPSAQGASSSAASTAPTTTTSVADPQYGPGRHDVSFDVNGVTRTAVLVVPADLTHPAPLVFAFHGHGGNGAAFDRRIDIDGLWPQAIVIYPDGLPGHKGITDPEGVLPGWQVRPGDEGDRDLAFYDTMLSTLRAKLPVDDARIYVMGHSNGSAFTALLLGLRGTSIAATATMSGQPAKSLLDAAPTRPMFLMMGRTDPLVPFEQQQQAIPLAEAKLGVDPTTAATDGYLTSERGPNGLELETYVHPGGHDVPPEVPPLVVQFFQRHTLPVTGR